MGPYAGITCNAFSTQGVKMEKTESISRKDLEVNLAWLAGFVDGEGNINVGFYKNGKNHAGNYWKTFRIEVVMSNTHADSIERCTEILKQIGCFFKVDLKIHDKKKWHPCFGIIVQGQKNAIKLLKAIKPYLTCKNETAQQAINAYEYRKNLTLRGPNNQWCYKYSQEMKRNVLKEADEIGIKRAALKNNIGWASIYRWKRQMKEMGKKTFMELEPIKDRVQDDPILLKMAERAKQLVHWRPNPLKYSRIASQVIKIKKSSEIIRLTAIKADDMIRSHVEA